MSTIFRQSQLYRFLFYSQDHSEENNLSRSILDCGAGGIQPPLGLFHSFQYETAGIEFSDQQIQRAAEFEKKENINLNIRKGDMRELPFSDHSFSFVYSYNSVFHMPKSDIKKSINEMKRVARPGGLLYVNLLTENDTGFGTGEKVGHGEYLQEEHGGQVIHSYFSTEEQKKLFDGENVILREERILDRKFDDGMYRQGYVDYILEV